MQPIRPEVIKGIDYLKQLIRHTRVHIGEVSQFQGRNAYLLNFERNSQPHTIFVSGEFLSDLPGTPEYQKSAKTYAETLEKRMLNLSVSAFHCVSGVPLSIEIDWPLDRIPGHASFAVRVQVHDLKAKDKVALCAVKISDHQLLFDLAKDPFRREQAIVNSIRGAADRGDLRYFLRAEHPTQLPFVELVVRSSRAGNQREMEEFLIGKVYWLGFNEGDRQTRVWIADPWDAEYLGTSDSAMIRAAQILEANKLISLDPSQHFASVADGLLTRARASGKIPGLAESALGQVEWNTRPMWDVFICHASEDKEQFVKPLAEALRKKSLKVWYDEFELTLGDGLRQSIDRGLRDSRFGIVVLSHAFFAKPWPQRELDGLTAREMNGMKVILPVWHNLTKDNVLSYSPTLADKLAVSSSKGLDTVVKEIIRALEPLPASPILVSRSGLPVGEEIDPPDWAVRAVAEADLTPYDRDAIKRKLSVARLNAWHPRLTIWLTNRSDYSVLVKSLSLWHGKAGRDHKRLCYGVPSDNRKFVELRSNAEGAPLAFVTDDDAMLKLQTLGIVEGHLPTYTFREDVDLEVRIEYDLLGVDDEFRETIGVRVHGNRQIESL